jgi:hypothetical protein
MKFYTDILLEKERLELLEFTEKNVESLGPDHPGLQSFADFHKHEELKILINKIKPFIEEYIIQKCWANLSNGDFIYWHKHDASDKSIVYYLKNKSNIGTMFKKEGHKIEVSEGVENSLLIFDSKLLHSVPCHLPEERYSITFDLIKK